MAPLQASSMNSISSSSSSSNAEEEEEKADSLKTSSTNSSHEKDEDDIENDQNVIDDENIDQANKDESSVFVQHEQCSPHHEEDSDKDNEEVIEPAIQITLDATDTDGGDE